MELRVPFLQLPQRTPRPRLLAGGLAMLGAACVGAELLGLAWWLTAERFKSALSPKPFDALSFVGLLLFTACGAVGVSLLCVSVSALMRLLGGVLGLAAFGALGTAFLTVGCLGMLWGKEIMRCSGIFCLNTSKYPVGGYNKPESAVAFLSVIGITAFFSLVPMGLVMLVQVVLRATSLDRRWLDPSRQRLSILREYPAVYSAVACVLLVCFALVTLYYPNELSLFTPGRIALRAKVRATQNFTLCTTVKQYTCPELPWSWVFTRNWVWSDSLVLKMYPSNIFFFSYLLTVLLTVTVIRGSRGGRNFLKRRCPSVLRAFSYGEAAFAVLTTLMLLLFFAYWVGGHNYKCRYDGVKDGTPVTDRWARSFGQLAVAFMSLCMFPASRYSVLHSILGTSWESSLWVHQVLGYGMLLATAAHMLVWYVRYAEVGIFPQAVFTLLPMFPVGHADNYTIPLISLVTWFMFVAIGVFSLEPVRRRFFELFYYLHMLAFYMIVPCVLWHAAAAWEYLLPGLTVWFVDRMVRMYRSASTAEVVSAIENGAYVQIQFRHSTLCAGPGQYAFVNIPELSLLQWHPFSLSVSREGCYAFHIKSMGEGTWTGRLVQLVKDRGSDFSLSVDGPYGRVQDFTDYKSVVLVAGGIGVTPCATIYSYLRRQRALTGKGPAVTLLWTLRDADILRMMSHLWEDWDSEDFTSAIDLLDFRIKLFLTGNRWPDDSTLGNGVEVSKGRVVFDAELSDALCGADVRESFAFVSAPKRVIQFVHDLCVSRGLLYHDEEFLLYCFVYLLNCSFFFIGFCFDLMFTKVGLGGFYCVHCLTKMRVA